MDRDLARHRWAFDDLAARVVRAVSDDDRNFYEDLATHAGDESAKGARELWQAIKHALPRWSNKRRANLRCTGPSIADQLEHYDQLEAGHEISYEQLLHRCHQAQRQASLDIPLTMKLRDLPTRIDVEALGCNIKVNKASGIDMIIPTALKDACQCVAFDG